MDIMDVSIIGIRKVKPLRNLRKYYDYCLRESDTSI